MKIPLKIVRQEKVRRVSAETFEEVMRIVEGWSDGKRFLLQYDDNEGDVISIESQLEWKECVRLWESECIDTPMKSLRLQLSVIDDHHTNSYHPDIVSDVVCNVLKLIYGDNYATELQNVNNKTCNSWLFIDTSPNDELILDANVPNLRDFLSHSGNTYLSLLQYADAMKWYKLLLQLEPTNESALSNLKISQMAIQSQVQDNQEATLRRLELERIACEDDPTQITHNSTSEHDRLRETVLRERLQRFSVRRER